MDRRPRILLVEDNDSDVEVTQIAWREALGEADFAVARDCRAATDALAGGPVPDLVLLDLNLPGCHGCEVLDVARERGVPTPIVVFTTSDNPRDRERCLALGAVDYVVKPDGYGDLLELLARLRRHLPRLAG